MVSWSTRTVSTTRHISMSCCQSRLLRAKRETSRAATAPTLPRQTCATIRSKPARCTPPAVINHIDLGPTEYGQTIAHGILQRAALPVVQNLMSRRLPDVENRLAL